ncbi:T9SS type A sorting domain-containing protein [candidate division KSB1 bacterium]|nr:T9SS type A sorting domain-containing protein [candidate division KSB1 bacterium]
MKAGPGITFVDPANNPVVYMFLIYLNPDKLLSEKQIREQISAARSVRQSGEDLLNQGIERGNESLKAQGRTIIKEGWEKMRDEENFATVFINALDLEHPGIEMYRGLPLNFVALPDAEDKIKSKYNLLSSTPTRFVFNGLFDMCAEFQVNGTPVFINLKTGDFSDFETACINRTLQNLFKFGNTPQNPTHILADDPAPPFQAKISGVPDYQTIYSKGCAPAAAGCVLGYHDANYPLLIDGGDKNYPGQRDPNGYGYLHTIWDELANAMDYVEGTGTLISKIDQGIRAVCNFPQYENNYNFTISYGNWASPSSIYGLVRSETKYKRPMHYSLMYPTYAGAGGVLGYHAVTLIGYGCLLPPWIDPDPRVAGVSKKLNKTNSTEPYEYVYICHDNNTTTGTDVYLWWSEFESTGYHITIRPGGYHPAATFNPEPSYCRNYPNPFNPSTEIIYTLSQNSPVTMKIFNINGQCIRTFYEGKKGPGIHQILWNGMDSQGFSVPAGQYFYQLLYGANLANGKMTLIK